MLKNKLIISPLLLPWNWSADYQKQTLTRLAKYNQVVLYDQTNSQFFLRPHKHTNHPPLPKNISLFTPTYHLPFRRLPFIEELNKRISWFLFLWQHRRRSKIIWIFDPFFAFMKPAFNSLSLYDCVDFHLEKEESELIKTTNLMFVNSHVLQKLHRPKRKDITLVPQGFDLESFRKAPKKQAPWKFAKPKQPVIGFVGGINSRIDWPLVEKLASKNPQWNFAFWGPLQTDEARAKIAHLRHLPNFAYGQTVHKDEVASLLHHLDVGIIPYIITDPFNLHSYPMKVFEYFYVGKPIVSTPIIELRRFPQLIKMCNSPGEWQKALRTLLQKPWPAAQQRAQRKLAIENNWENKIQAISHYIKTA